jgi:uncharacterized protein
MELGGLPPDTFVSRVPRAWQERVPRVEATDHGPEWHASGVALGAWGKAWAKRYARVGLRGKRMEEAGLSSSDMRISDPKLRIEDQKLDGIDAEVIYGVFRLVDSLHSDPELLSVCLSAYNDFIAEFCQHDSHRLIGLGVLPFHDPDIVAKEVRRIGANGLGLRGAELAYNFTNPPIWHADWEPVWTAAEEHQVSISFHIRGGTTTVTHKSRDAASSAAALAVLPMQADEALASMVMCGALERHPGLKIVLAESGIGWVPYVIERMEYEWQERLSQDERFKHLLRTPPAELFRRQIFATFQQDCAGLRLAEIYAPDNFMWGSDYPHPDGVWPDSLEILAEQKAASGISDDLFKKITCGNAKCLYRLGDN